MKIFGRKIQSEPHESRYFCEIHGEVPVMQFGGFVPEASSEELKGLLRNTYCMVCWAKWHDQNVTKAYAESNKTAAGLEIAR